MLLDRRLPDGDSVSAIRRFRALQPVLRIVVVIASDTLQSDPAAEGPDMG
ncbi:hypothetical protein [Methylocystis bryophila]